MTPSFLPGGYASFFRTSFASELKMTLQNSRSQQEHVADRHFLELFCACKTGKCGDFRTVAADCYASLCHEGTTVAMVCSCIMEPMPCVGRPVLTDRVSGKADLQAGSHVHGTTSNS